VCLNHEECRARTSACNCQCFGGATRLHRITTVPLLKTGNVSVGVACVKVSVDNARPALFSKKFTIVLLRENCGVVGGVASPVSPKFEQDAVAGRLCRGSGVGARDANVRVYLRSCPRPPVQTLTWILKFLQSS
jgi:hypothetical protein